MFREIISLANYNIFWHFLMTIQRFIGKMRFCNSFSTNICPFFFLKKKIVFNSKIELKIWVLPMNAVLFVSLMNSTIILEKSKNTLFKFYDRLTQWTQ